LHYSQMAAFSTGEQDSKSSCGTIFNWCMLCDFWRSSRPMQSCHNFNPEETLSFRRQWMEPLRGFDLTRYHCSNARVSNMVQYSCVAMDPRSGDHLCGNVGILLCIVFQRCRDEDTLLEASTAGLNPSRKQVLFSPTARSVLASCSSGRFCPASALSLRAGRGTEDCFRELMRHGATYGSRMY
jgi:hypothetical protein